MKIIETCELSEDLQLQQPTLIACPRDFKASAPLRILTGGHDLHLLVFGKADFNGLSIVAGSVDRAGRIQLEAKSATGRLHVNNAAARFGGDVRLRYVTVYDYTHDIEPGEGANIQFTLNGEDSRELSAQE